MGVIEGDADGTPVVGIELVGATVGSDWVGDLDSVGVWVGEVVGDLVGDLVGEVVGFEVVGDSVLYRMSTEPVISRSPAPGSVTVSVVMLAMMVGSMTSQRTTMEPEVLLWEGTTLLAPKALMSWPPTDPMMAYSSVKEIVVRSTRKVVVTMAFIKTTRRRRA